MNFDALFAALDDRPVVEVNDIPGLAAPVYMRSLSVDERDALQRAVLGDDYKRKSASNADWSVGSLLAILCEADGARLAKADAEKLDKALRAGNVALVDALIARANKIGVSGQDAVESAEKNSATTESDASASS